MIAFALALSVARLFALHFFIHLVASNFVHFAHNLQSFLYSLFHHLFCYASTNIRLNAISVALWEVAKFTQIYAHTIGCLFILPMGRQGKASALALAFARWAPHAHTQLPSLLDLYSVVQGIRFGGVSISKSMPQLATLNLCVCVVICFCQFVENICQTFCTKCRPFLSFSHVGSFCAFSSLCLATLLATRSLRLALTLKLVPPYEL